ncbi:MAG: hypothetical protein ACYCT2_01480 [Thermoplasmataceae archaeon]
MKISKIPDQKELKKSLGKLKSFVKVPETGASLNKKSLEIPKNLQTDSSSSPMPILQKVKS